MAHGDNPSNKTKNNKTKNNKTRLARLLIFILLIGSLLSEGFFSRAQFAAAFDYNNAYAEPYLETKTVSEPTGTEARGTYPVEAYEGDGPENTRNFEYMMGGDVVYRATDWDGADQALMSYNRTVDDLGDGRYFRLFPPNMYNTKINRRRIVHGNQGTIDDHGVSTRSQVRLMREEGIELYTIGYTMRQDGGVANPDAIMMDIFDQPGWLPTPAGDDDSFATSQYYATNGVPEFDQAFAEILYNTTG